MSCPKGISPIQAAKVVSTDMEDLFLNLNLPIVTSTLNSRDNVNPIANSSSNSPPDIKMVMVLDEKNKRRLTMETLGLTNLLKSRVKQSLMPLTSESDTVLVTTNIRLLVKARLKKNARKRQMAALKREILASVQTKLESMSFEIDQPE